MDQARACCRLRFPAASLLTGRLFYLPPHRSLAVPRDDFCELSNVVLRNRVVAFSARG